jgi:hypothetical protein
MAMANQGVSVVQYFTTKLRLAKEAGFDSTAQQLLAVWNGLDVEIREFIPEPDDTTTVDQLRRWLEDRERLWKEKLFRNRSFNQNVNARFNNYQPQFPRVTNTFPYNAPIRSNDRPYWPGQSTPFRGGQRPE